MVDMAVRGFAAAAVVVALGCGGGGLPMAQSGSQLRRIDGSATVLKGRGLRDSDIPGLERLDRLEVLNLSAGAAAVAQRLSSRGFENLAKLHLPRLHTLTVSCSDAVNDDAAKSIASMTRLRFVALRRCGSLSNSGVAALARMPNLEELDLRGCGRVTDDAVIDLVRAAGLKRPRSLQVTATGISEDGVRRLVAHFGREVVDSDAGWWRAEDPAASGVVRE
jgi:hypothetical protein